MTTRRYWYSDVPGRYEELDKRRLLGAVACLLIGLGLLRLNWWKDVTPAWTILAPFIAAIILMTTATSYTDTKCEGGP